MPTEKAAHLAREMHSERLRELGAHAVTIGRVTRGGKTSSAVVAMFEQKPKDLPKSLAVKVGTKVVEVPLVARKAERFRAE